MAIVTAADLAARLGRTLTPDEAADVENGVAAAVDMLESMLHRAVEVGQFVESRRPLAEGMTPASLANGWSIVGGGAGARVYLAHRPLASIVSVKTITGNADITAACHRDGDTVLVPTLDWVEITYVAGDDPPSPLVKRMIIRALARELFQPAAVASGAYTSYSVEGSSFAVSAPAPDQTWPLNNNEMRALRRALGRLEIR